MGTPASDQGPGRSLPGPDAGHPCTVRAVTGLPAPDRRHRQAPSPARSWPLSFPSGRRRWRGPGRNEAGDGSASWGKGDEQTPTPGAAPGLAAPAAPIGEETGKASCTVRLPPRRGPEPTSFRRGRRLRPSAPLRPGALCPEPPYRLPPWPGVRAIPYDVRAIGSLTKCNVLARIEMRSILIVNIHGCLEFQDGRK
jgi:hypothetical protein